MTEFNELELAKDVSEMEPEEAKDTLSEFMDAHEQNKDAYDALRSEKRASEEEYSEKIEELEDRVSQFKQERAEEAAQYANMPAELLAERFSFSELDKIIEEAEDAEFSREESEESEDEEDEKLTTFSDRPQKGRQESSGGSKYSTEKAREKIRQHW